jgi:hypothetical protein
MWDDAEDNNTNNEFASFPYPMMKRYNLGLTVNF